jgi:hypothetical protein
MTKTDFTKTSEQVERDTLTLIDKVERSLETSTSESERKGQLVFGAILSVIVFTSILAFEYLVGSKKAPIQSMAPNKNELLSSKEIQVIRIKIDRIERELSSLESTKNRVAPAMPVDSNIQNIRDSLEDISNFLQENQTAPATNEQEQIRSENLTRER